MIWSKNFLRSSYKTFCSSNKTILIKKNFKKFLKFNSIQFVGKRDNRSFGDLLT